MPKVYGLGIPLDALGFSLEITVDALHALQLHVPMEFTQEYNELNIRHVGLVLQ